MNLKFKSNQMFSIFILSFILTYLFISSTGSQNYLVFSQEQDSVSTITLAFVGDLMCHTPQIKTAINDSNKIDFEPVFELVRNYLAEPDFTAGNLETTIGDSNDTYTGYPRFRSPTEYLRALKNSGFDLLFTANNHMLDYGEKGILKTIEKLKQYKLHYTGSFESFNDYDSLRIFTIKNIRVCFIAATYGTNGNLISNEKKYLLNLINPDSLKSQVIKAKNAQTDLIVVNLHFGDEYSFTPNKFQKQVVDSLISYGVDIIIGNHPHVLQPLRLESSINSKIDNVLVAYSLGNFLSNQRKLETATGAILYITIEKNLTTNRLKLKTIKIIPTYVYKGMISKKLQYKIIPLTHEMINSDFIRLNSINEKILRNSYELSKRIIFKDFSHDSLKFIITF